MGYMYLWKSLNYFPGAASGWKRRVGTDRRLGFCFQNRYNPSVIKVKELLASGEAGKIRGARGIVTWSRGKEYYTESGWRNSGYRGGGALINQSVHTAGSAGLLLGTPLSERGGRDTEPSFEGHY